MVQVKTRVFVIVVAVITAMSLLYVFAEDANATSIARKQGKNAAKWAVKIANDNSFTFGAGSKAHRKGCYFCGTNVK